MSEITAILEDIRRQVTAGPDAFERVARRRDRKRRNQRIGSAVLALLLAAAAIGAAIRIIGTAERQLPANHGISPDNVKDLELAWAAMLHGTPSNTAFRSLELLQPFAPTVVDGKVYEGTTIGMLYAFDASCGADGSTCKPSWVADTGGRIANPPAVADGMVFVSSEGGILAAYPTDCGVGAATCHPTWIAHTQRPFDTPSVVGGVVYGVDAIHGVVYAFDEHCGTGGETCQPLWTAPTETTNAKSVGGYFWPVVVSGGVVYAVGGNPPEKVFAFDATNGRTLWWGGPSQAPTHGTGQHDPVPIVADGLVIVGPSDIYAFPIGCRSDGGRCDPIWTAANGDWRIVQDGTLFVKSFESFEAGSVSAYDLHCATEGAVCRPLWTAETGGWGDFVSGDGILISTANRSVGRIDAFPMTCGAASSCDPLWTAQLKGARTPLIAGGLVYVPTAAGKLYAFPLACGSDGGACEPIWTAPGIDVQTSPPTIVGERLFVASADGRLFAFALPARANGATVSRSSAPTSVFYLGLAVLAGILIFSRVRRRVF